MEDEDEDNVEESREEGDSDRRKNGHFSTPPGPFLKLLIVFSDLGPRSENTLKFTWRTLLAEI